MSIAEQNYLNVYRTILCGTQYYSKSGYDSSLVVCIVCNLVVGSRMVEVD